MTFAKNYRRWIIERFKPYLGDTVAEIGAGTGNFTSSLVETGIKNIFALETSDNMYPKLKNKFQGEKRSYNYKSFFG